MVESIAERCVKPAVKHDELCIDRNEQASTRRSSSARLRPAFRRAAACALAASALLAGSGCGKFFQKTTGTTGTTTPTSTTDRLYVANNNATLNTISGFSIASGALTKLTNSPYLLGQTPSVLALTPGNSLLYAGSTLAGIYVFTVNSDGSLTIGGGGSAVAGVSAQSIVIDPTGKWLLALQTQGNGAAPIVSVFAINATTGALTTQGTPLALSGGVASQLLFIPSTTGVNLVYAALSTGGIDALSFNTTTGNLGTLSLHQAPLDNAGADIGLATNPTGTLLFATETGINGIRTFTINADGTFPELTASSPLKNTGSGVGAALVDATGAYLYVANLYNSTVSGYSISSAGALTALTGSPFTTGAAPVALIEDSTKGYLAVACSGGSPDLEVFPFSTTVPGALGTAVGVATGGTTSPAIAYALAASH